MVEEGSGEEWTEEIIDEEDDIMQELSQKLHDKDGNIVEAYDRRKARPGNFYYEQVVSEDPNASHAPFVGAIVAPNANIPVNPNAPDMELELEHVYGYRCFDTRQNIFFNKSTHEIVYCAAALGIVLDVNARTQRFFGGKEVRQMQGHTDDITALAVHPTRTLVATGEVGKNPAIIVWDSSSCSEVSAFRQSENSRAVTALAFSGDGNLLVSCALDNFHTVRVWDWAHRRMVSENRGGPDKILDCAWSQTDHTFVTAGIKHINFWSESTNYDKKRGIFGKAKTCNMTTAQYLPTGQAVTGGGNGFLYLWDGNRCSLSKCPHRQGAGIHTLKASNEYIVSGSADSSLVVLSFTFDEVARFTLDSFPRSCDFLDGRIVTGCRNGSIYIIEGGNTTEVMSSHSDGEAWGLAVSERNPDIAVSVGDDNQLKVWNLEQHICVESLELEAKAGKARKVGIGASTLARTAPNQQARCVTINPNSGHIAIGFNNGKLMIKAGINALDNTLARFKHAKEWIEAMRYSPNGQWLAVGSHDNAIYIYDANDYSLKSHKFVHSSYITELDWSCDSQAIKSCCGAYELIFWSVSPSGALEHNPSGASELADETWDTYSTHFGWNLQGIFGNMRDYTHVNRVDRSCNKSTFAVGNDWGLVELFRNPNDKTCRSKGYKAHSEHVTNVKWTSDGRYLL